MSGAPVIYTDTAQGFVGIGTGTPAARVHIVGNMTVGTTPTYANYTSVVPVSDGRINGVNITALNARTRTSAASAVEAVSRWVTRTSAADNDWYSVTWAPELSIFVAVAVSGTGNRVATSSDSTTWVTRASAADNQWLSVEWAPKLSLFVAVANTGTGNRVCTSPDGVTWTTQASPADNAWRLVCWAPELSLFVAVASTGTGNRVMTSSNGIAWTTRVSAADNQWFFVMWASELSIFVAVGRSGTGNRIMTSSDGFTWTTRGSPADNIWNAVSWAPELSLFAAVAESGTGNRIMTSSDGITWRTRISPADNNWNSVTWAPELSTFVAVAFSGTGNRVATSPDGITWTTRTSAADNGWLDIIWSPELSVFIAIAYRGTGNRVMTSAIGMPNSESVVKALPSQLSVSPTGFLSGAISGMSAGVYPSHLYYRLNETIIGLNSTAVQNALGVSVTLSAGTQYDFEAIYLMSRTAGATSHTIRSLFGGTATLNNIGYTAFYTGSSGGFNNTVGVVITTAVTVGTAVIITNTITSSTPGLLIQLKGSVSINAGGTFTPQYSLSAAPGGAFTMAIGSYFRIWPVGSAGANINVGGWA